MEVAYERHRSLSISDAPITSEAMRASPLLPPASGPYNPAASAGSFGAARTRSRSASFSTYCPPPIVVPSNNLSDPAFPGSTSPSPSGYRDPAFPASSCSPSTQDFGLSSCENSPAFPGHSPTEFFQARTVVRSPNQELVRQRAAESADMDSQWELPPSPGLRTPCTCRRNPCACAVLAKRAARTGPPLSSSNWGRRLRRSLSGGTSAGASDGEGGAEPRRSRSLLLRRSKTSASSNATSDTEDMGYSSGTGGAANGESGRSTTGRRAQFARLFTRTGTAPPRPSTANGFHSESLEGILSPNHAAPYAAANHVSPPVANRGFVARCVSVDAAAAGMSGGKGGVSNAERSGRPSSATSQKYSRSPSPTSSGSRGAAAKGEGGSGWRITGSRVTASGITSPPPADLSPESLPTVPNHPNRGGAPVPRVISIDNAVAWLNSTRKGSSHSRGSVDGAAIDGGSPASRVPGRRASFGGGSSRSTNASIGSATSANEDDLSRAWDEFTASAAAAATGIVPGCSGGAGDSCVSSSGASNARRAEQQAAVARKRQPQSQQKASEASKQNAFRPSASCGSLVDLVPDDYRAVEYGGGGYGGGGSSGGGYGSDFSKPSKSKDNLNLGSTHPPSRRGLSRPTAPPPRPFSPNAAPRATHSRSPSASSAVGTSPPGQSRGGESTEPIRFRGPQGPLQHPPQSPHQKLSSQGLPLRSPRHTRHHSMGSAAALASHPSPRATAHATAATPLATAATAAGLVMKTAGDSVPRPFATGPRRPPSVLIGISQSLRSHSVQSVQSPSTPRSPGHHSPPPHSPRSAAPLSPRSSAPAPLSPRASAPLPPRSFAAAPLSPRSSAPAPLSPRSFPTPLSPRSSAPLSPRSFSAAPLSPRSSAPLSPRSFATPLSPHASALLSPRASAPLSPRSSAPFSPRSPAPRSQIPRSNTTTRTPLPPSAAAGFKAPAALDQARARNAPAPRRHVRSASVAEVTSKIGVTI
ncbi:unnamed protein product [Closterium sp. Yama58-4]|nr:unnamed protein product [Closterium sp. Yama58-4]